MVDASQHTPLLLWPSGPCGCCQVLTQQRHQVWPTASAASSHTSSISCQQPHQQHQLPAASLAGCCALAMAAATPRPLCMKGHCSTPQGCHEAGCSLIQVGHHIPFLGLQHMHPKHAASAYRSSLNTHGTYCARPTATAAALGCMSSCNQLPVADLARRLAPSPLLGRARRPPPPPSHPPNPSYTCCTQAAVLPHCWP